jgi:predicted nucleic acid-binding protein
LSGFVLDASIALAWCFDNEASPVAAHLLDRLETEFAIVPAIWPIELANVLANAERRGRIVSSGIAEFLALIAPLDIQVDAETPARGLKEILTLARSEALSGYDAAYLELAMRLGVPLATRDVRLASAARRVGVEVFDA